VIAALKSCVKKFAVLIVLATAVFFSQRRTNQEPAAAAKAPATAKATVSATPRPVYEHDWAKHSLDRAHAVVDEVQKSRQEDNPP
jgi:hypothetical protein